MPAIAMVPRTFSYLTLSTASSLHMMEDAFMPHMLTGVPRVIQSLKGGVKMQIIVLLSARSSGSLFLMHM